MTIALSVACYWLAAFVVAVLEYAHHRAAAAVMFLGVIVGLSSLVYLNKHPQQFAGSPVSAEFFVGKVGDPVYHIAGCPLPGIRDVIFRSQAEAAWAGKKPCTFCLTKTESAGASSASPAGSLAQRR